MTSTSELSKKTSGKFIKMPLKSFISEHKALIPLLKTGSHFDLVKEALKQAREVKEKTGVKVK